MKVGEFWRAIAKEVNKIPPWERGGSLIRITRIYRDDEEMQDYVDYDVIEYEDGESEYNAIGGGMTREELLKCYRRLNVE